MGGLCFEWKVMTTLFVFLLFPWLRMVQVVIPITNTYHLTITCDTITNAQWYSVIVQYKGIEAQRRYAMTNVIAVSNLSSDLSSYRFTMTATNLFGESDESVPAPLHLTTVQTSNDLTNWQKAPSVIYDPTTNASRFLRLSNYSAETLLKPD